MQTERRRLYIAFSPIWILVPPTMRAGDFSLILFSGDPLHALFFFLFFPFLYPPDWRLVGCYQSLSLLFLLFFPSIFAHPSFRSLVIDDSLLPLFTADMTGPIARLSCSPQTARITSGTIHNCGTSFSPMYARMHARMQYTITAARTHTHNNQRAKKTGKEEEKRTPRARPALLGHIFKSFHRCGGLSPTTHPLRPLHLLQQPGAHWKILRRAEERNAHICKMQ